MGRVMNGVAAKLRSSARICAGILPLVLPLVFVVNVASISAGLSAVGVSPAFAGEADVLAVDITPRPDGTFRFSVTVRHADDGWDHYADAWEVLAPDGRLLGTRVLRHPHESEQPFTRSLSGVEIPEGVSRVTVRARDLVHGFGGLQKQVDLPGR